MNYGVRAVMLTVLSMAVSQTAGAQSDPALRSPPPTAQTTTASLMFPAPSRATVKDGFVYALLGDIHGNTEALTVILNAIKEQKIDQIHALGCHIRLS